MQKKLCVCLYSGIVLAPANWWATIAAANERSSVDIVQHLLYHKRRGDPGHHESRMRWARSGRRRLATPTSRSPCSSRRVRVGDQRAPCSAAGTNCHAATARAPHPSPSIAPSRSVAPVSWRASGRRPSHDGRRRPARARAFFALLSLCFFFVGSYCLSNNIRISDLKATRRMRKSTCAQPCNRHQSFGMYLLHRHLQRCLLWATCWAFTWRTISPWRTIRPALEDYWLGGPFYLGRSVIHSLA
jgi:hypothetical protein